MLNIVNGHVTMSMENFAEALISAATDKELQNKLIHSFKEMEQYCNSLGCGDEEPTNSATEEDLRYEIVGTFINHVTEEEPIVHEEDDDNIPF